MRTRSRSNTPKRWCDQGVTNYYPTFSETHNPHQYEMVYGDQSVESMTDTVVESFKRRSRNGEILMNPLEHHKGNAKFPLCPYDVTITHTPVGSVTPSLKQRTYSNSGFTLEDTPDHVYNNLLRFNMALSTLGDPIEGAEGRTLTRAHSNASESTALALVTLAEAQKTMKLLPELMSLLEGFHSRVKSDRARPGFGESWLFERPGKPRTLKQAKRTALRRLGGLSSLWLQYRYGIMPLVYEINSFVQILRRKSDKLKRLRFTSSEEGSSLGAPVTASSAALLWSNHSGYKHSRYDRVTSGVIVQPVWDAAESVVDDLGLDRIGSSALELIPYSFVADWLFNVSEFIAAREGRFGQNVLGTWTTRRTSVFGSYWFETNFKPPFNNGSGVIYSAGGNRALYSTDHRVRVVRVANPNLVSLPSFRLKLNWKKWTDLAALAYQGKSLAKSVRY